MRPSSHLIHELIGIAIAAIVAAGGTVAGEGEAK